MKRVQVKELVSILVSAYPKWYGVDEKSVVGVWYMMLADQDSKEIFRIAKDFIETSGSENPPSISEILHLQKVIKDNQARIDEETHSQSI